MTEGSEIVAILMFHTSNVVVSDSSRFAFFGSITKVKLHTIPPSSEIIVAYHSLPASGPRPLTPEIHKVLEEANKP